MRAIDHCKSLIGRKLYENIKAFREGRIEEFKIDKDELKRIAAHALK